MPTPTNFKQEHIDEAVEIVKSLGCSCTAAAGTIIERHNLTHYNPLNFAKQVRRYYHKSASQEHGIEAVCDQQGIDINDVNHYWYKGEHHSIHVKNDAGELVDWEEIKSAIEREISRTYNPIIVKGNSKAGVLKWADLHLGAHIRNLVITPDFDSEILLTGLLKSVEKINSMNFSSVDVDIVGDLIESLSGLNHINSWMSMNKDEIGAKAIIVCTKILNIALQKINNLRKVRIVAGNHDRISKDNDEDVRGGAAEIIAWGLGLMGYDVEFHPYIIIHQVEGINHINLHGDKGISKMKTSDILWKYGKKGLFNFVFEGHLHTIIEKLSSNQRDNFKVLKDDQVDHRRLHLPAFFTGNYYSETLGFSASAGYVIVSDNGNGKPDVFMGAI